MEIAATTSVSVAPQPPRPSNAFSRKPHSVSSLPLASFQRKHCVGNDKLRVSASSSLDAVVAAEKISPASLLDKRETGGVLHFVKYHGLGNDFILVTLAFQKSKLLFWAFQKIKTLFFGGSRQVDNRDSSEPKITQEQAAKLCDRNFGVGADGVIFAMPGVNGTDYAMRIFNSDGSEPEVGPFSVMNNVFYE